MIIAPYLLTYTSVLEALCCNFNWPGMSGGTLESEIFGSENEDDEDGEDDKDYVGAHQDSDEDWQPPPEEEVVGDTPEVFTQDQDMNDSQEPEVAVVVDGHTNEDQVDYTQPKPPFAGTIWNGLLNGFPRVVQTDTSAPRGQRPTGYVWSVAINGWRRTLAQTLLDEQRIAEGAAVFCIFFLVFCI